jgi:hypothetical protein
MALGQVCARCINGVRLTLNSFELDKWYSGMENLLDVVLPADSIVDQPTDQRIEQCPRILSSNAVYVDDDVDVARNRYMLGLVTGFRICTA